MNSTTHAGTILVVDACEPLCELMEVILSRIGYRVFTATNGIEALDLARITPGIDLILCDVELPGMPGDKLATRFNVLHPSAGIVITSSSIEPIETAAPYELLEKPFTIDELRETAFRALRTRLAAAEMSPAG